MRQVECIVVGQGIAGTMMSYHLWKNNIDHILIDQSLQHISSSRVASGVINPLTGRKRVRTWMVDELFPFAKDAYQSIEKLLEINFFEEKDIISFPPNPEMVLNYENRIAGGESFLHNDNAEQWHPYFNIAFGTKRTSSSFWLHLETLLNGWRKFAQEHNFFKEETFNFEEINSTNESVTYKNITAKYLVLCTGIKAMQQPKFNSLPFSPNKGEALILKIPVLPSTHIFKGAFTLVPLKNEEWWLGSNYDNHFKDEDPTNEFKEKALHYLKNWLKLPFTFLHHQAAVRPATVERRPFIGFHPNHPRWVIFNGMGTKACSLAPYFANQLTLAIVHGTSILPEVDVRRFQKILMSNS